jgi:NitT/TauT family transport system permease protein
MLPWPMKCWRNALHEVIVNTSQDYPLKISLLPVLLPILSFVLMIAFWDLGSRATGCSRQVLPGPFTVVLSLVELIRDGSLLRHTVASLYRVTAGFYLAVALGIPLGIFLGRWEAAKHLINPVIGFLRPISPLAWIPLAVLWFGIGDRPAVFLIFLSSFFPMVVFTTIAVQRINPVYFQVAANFKFNAFERVSKIILPAILPSMVTALRLTVTIAWLVVVAAEMIAVQSGLGYLILDARNALRMDYVLDGMLVIGLIGLFLDRVMRRLGNITSAEWDGGAG